jgi:hypothetical protein
MHADIKRGGYNLYELYELIALIDEVADQTEAEAVRSKAKPHIT